MALEITDNNFNETVIQSDKPVLVDFWAEWCAPCKVLVPIVDELYEEFNGKAIVGKINVDNNPETAIKYGIRSIPTLLFFKNGEVVDKYVGTTSKVALAAKLEAQL